MPISPARTGLFEVKVPLYLAESTHFNDYLVERVNKVLMGGRLAQAIVLLNNAA